MKAADKEIFVESGQNLFDICIMQFGTVDNFFDLIKDNSLQVNSLITTGQKLLINNIGKGNEIIKQIVSTRNFVFCNNQSKLGQLGIGGDYNEDYNEDFLI